MKGGFLRVFSLGCFNGRFFSIVISILKSKRLYSGYTILSYIMNNKNRGGGKMSEIQTRCLIVSCGRQTIYFEDTQGKIWIVQNARLSDIKPEELFKEK